MSYITFGRTRTSAYGLIVAPYEIPMPPVQTNYVEVPGRNGSLDMTEAFGAVRYGDRVINLTLYAVGDYAQQVSNFVNDVHGKRMRIEFDKDPDYFYMGRISVSAIEKRDGYCAIGLEIIAEPYKQDTMETTVTREGNGRVSLQNGSMPVTPVIRTTAETSLRFTYNGASMTVTLSAGSHTVPQLTLAANQTLSVTVSVTGIGTTTFIYRKGWL